MLASKPGDVFRDLAQAAQRLALDGCPDPASMRDYAAYLEHIGAVADQAGGASAKPEQSRVRSFEAA